MFIFICANFINLFLGNNFIARICHEEKSSIFGGFVQRNG